MTYCTTCDIKYTDGTLCSSCKKGFCFACSAISESTYRKLGADKRATWRCPGCRITSPFPSLTVRETNLDDILKKLDEMTAKLDQLPKLIREMEYIKSEVRDIRKSCDISSRKINEFEVKLDNFSIQVDSFREISDEISTLTKSVDSLQQDQIDRDQWSRLNNVEIKGIPVKQNENLFQVVEKLSKLIEYPLQKSQINYISRVSTFKLKEKNIVLSFLNRHIKEEFISAVKDKKQISGLDLGYVGEGNTKIYINDHLSPHNKRLLTNVKSLCKEQNYIYCWVKYAKIHVKKNDISPIIVINSNKDLIKIK